ncbi:MAG: hypothetical protein II960_11115, partial [Synergistaceae bacterium]|nr:hypothetical protein [Synergistaceae bacterium]
KSLAVFKPNKIEKVVVEKRDRDWKKETLEALKAQARQLDLFKTKEELDAELKPAMKIPYAFKYKFVDDVGIEASLMIEDWEIGMLYLNCLKLKRDESLAIQDVKNKLEDFAKTKDIYFFLGTAKEWHNVSPNPFLIVGIFYPPFERK